MKERESATLIFKSNNEYMADKYSTSIKDVKHPNGRKVYPLRLISETTLTGFFIVDREWRVLYWNDAAEKLLNVQSEEIVGYNVWVKFAGSIPVDFYEVYHEAFLQDIPVHFEKFWKEMNAWFEVTTCCINDTLSVSFKCRKQSARRPHTLHELKIVNELYQFVTEITNVCLWEWNLQTREIFWIDGGHKRIFGYQIENAFVPQGFWESCIHPEDKRRILKKLDGIISQRTRNEWEDEYRFKKSNGEYAYVQDRGHIIYEGEEGCRMIGATRDISSGKLTEMQLLESERKLSLIARQTVNAVIITDSEEKIIWVNKAFTRISGYSPGEVMGKNRSALLQGKETDLATTQYIKQKMADQQSFDCQQINYNKSGRKYWVHVQGQALLDSTGKCTQFFFIETDITEKILLENRLMEEIHKRQKEITHAVLTAQEKERTDIGKELHDNLNQILGAAKLYIEMARADAKNKEIYLQKSSGFIVDVINEIRKISKNWVVSSMHVLGLCDSIKILLEDVMMIHPIQIDFDSGCLTEEYLDEKLQLNIFRIVQEQMNNIIKHAKATRASIHLKKEGNELILVITDDGIGCDISKDTNGGVGLINIRSRAELFHGKVVIVSEPGKGYQLNVTLSLTEFL